MGWSYPGRKPYDGRDRHNTAQTYEQVANDLTKAIKKCFQKLACSLLIVLEGMTEIDTAAPPQLCGKSK